MKRQLIVLAALFGFLMPLQSADIAYSDYVSTLTPEEQLMVIACASGVVVYSAYRYYRAVSMDKVGKSTEPAEVEYCESKASIEGT